MSGEWYNAYKVVPADNRAVLVLYSTESNFPVQNRHAFIGVARYEKNKYVLASGNNVDWLVERVAEDGERWMKDTVNINACDADGSGLQVWEWKDLTM